MDTSQLLTEEAKINKIKQLLPKTGRHGSFFVPDEVFYTPPQDAYGLKSMSKQISHWAGFKPVGLEIQFSTALSQDYALDVHESKPFLLIHERYHDNPFICARLLAEGLMQYYFEFRKEILLSDPAEHTKLISLAVVYGGFGLLALNSPISVWHQRYPKIFTKLPHNNEATVKIYTHFIKRFSQEYGLELGSFSRYLCPWALAVLRLEPSRAPVAYAARSSKLIQRNTVALGFGIVSLLVSITAASYVLVNKPQQLSASQLQDKEAVEILKKSHELCLEAVARKQRAYDQSDFFVQRNLDGDRMRCMSIRNLHNSRVEHLSSQL